VFFSDTNFVYYIVSNSIIVFLFTDWCTSELS